MSKDAALEHGVLHRPTGDLHWSRTVESQAHRTPLILVHGGPGMPSDYLEGLRELASERQVILYDQIGCGRSPATNAEAVDLRSMSADLLALIDHLGLNSCVLLGHSFGGMLIAETYRHSRASALNDAGSIAAMIFTSPLITTDRWVADAQARIRELPIEVQQQITAPRTPEDAAAGEDAFYRRFFCALDPWPEELQRTMDSMGTDVYEHLWGPNEFTPTGVLVEADSSDVLANITVPTLWICGTEDEVLPSTLRTFADLCPQSEVSIIVEGTHSVHLEQTESYLTAIRSFLETLPARR